MPLSLEILHELVRELQEEPSMLELLASDAVPDADEARDPFSVGGVMALLWAPDRRLSFVSRNQAVATARALSGKHGARYTPLPNPEGYDMSGILDDAHGAQREHAFKLVHLVEAEPELSAKADASYIAIAELVQQKNNADLSEQEPIEAEISRAVHDHLRLFHGKAVIFTAMPDRPFYPAKGDYDPENTDQVLASPGTMLAHLYATQKISRAVRDTPPFLGLTRISGGAAHLSENVIRLDGLMRDAAQAVGIDPSIVPVPRTDRLLTRIKQNRRGLELMVACTRLSDNYPYEEFERDPAAWEPDAPYANCLRLIGAYPPAPFVIENDLEAAALLHSAANALYLDKETEVVYPYNTDFTHTIDDPIPVPVDVERLGLICKRAFHDAAAASIGCIDRDRLQATVRRIQEIANIYTETALIHPRQQLPETLQAISDYLAREQTPILPPQAARAAQAGRA